MLQAKFIFKNSAGNTGSFIFKSILPLWLLFMFFSCGNHQSSNKQKAGSTSVRPSANTLSKPAGTFRDTLTISNASAVFYHPDSIQLAKIKQLTDSVIFAGTMHDFFYQMRNARLVIKKNWPGLKIVECINYRWLRFLKKDGSREYIDLDTKNDAYGLFVFDGEKTPVLVDMTNIETEISFYLMK